MVDGKGGAWRATAALRVPRFACCHAGRARSRSHARCSGRACKEEDGENGGPRASAAPIFRFRSTARDSLSIFSSSLQKKRPPPATMEERKPVIKAVDMSEDMQRDAVECAATVSKERDGRARADGRPFQCGNTRARAGTRTTCRVCDVPACDGEQQAGGTASARASTRAACEARVVFRPRPLLPPLPRPSTSTPWRRTSPPTSSASLTSGTRPRGTAWWGATLVSTKRRGGRRTDTRAAAAASFAHATSFLPSGSYVTHETKNFIYFYLGPMAVLLFKTA